jgi:hypothetical protein
VISQGQFRMTARGCSDCTVPVNEENILIQMICGIHFDSTATTLTGLLLSLNAHSGLCIRAPLKFYA